MNTVSGVSVSQVEMEKLLAELKKQLRQRYPSPPVLRAFHPKMHGLLKAKFEVPDDLPAPYHSPLFVAGKSYEAYVRFSNGSRVVQSDMKKDLRGLAIKIMGVPGLKVLETEQYASTQDLLLANYPIFPPGTFHGTVKGIIATSGSVFRKILFALTHIGTVIKAIQSARHCNNLVNETYFSQVPYQYNELFVKFVLKPRTQEPLNQAPSGDNFLREYLSASVKHNAVYFDLFVQPKTPADPLNDASVEWKGPLQKVATLTLLPQVFDTAAQNTLGEQLSFTPWHTLPEHQPAGDIGLARKEIYSVMSAFRHHDNTLPEPTTFNL